MKARLAQLAARFEALTLRERALVSLGVLVLLFLLWDTLLMSPEHRRQQQMVGQMHGINQQLTELETQIETLGASLQSGEDQVLQARLRELRDSLGRLEQSQTALTVQFVKPEQMAGLLRDVLSSDRELKLVSLKSLGSKPLFPPAEKAEGEAQRPLIYQHAMRISFEGRFFNSLRYLRALEAMPWRFYWDRLDYQVLDYPTARVSITVHTLSLEEGWIGV